MANRQSQSRKAVFLDRDGVINQKMPEGQYVTKWEQFLFLPGVFDAIGLLNENGYLVVVVTNQRCVAKGIISEDELEEIHHKMILEIKAHGGRVDKIYYCPHHIDDPQCNCRKPKPGMILQALEDFRREGIDIDVANSFLVGDAESDILAGKAVGLRCIQVDDEANLFEVLRSFVVG